MVGVTVSLNVSEWLFSDVKWAISYIILGTNDIWWDYDDFRFVLDQHAWLDFFSASSVKQQFAGMHVAPLRHIILSPNQPVFVIDAYCLAANTTCMVSGLTRPRLEHTIYCTRGVHTNHHTTDEVKKGFKVEWYIKGLTKSRRLKDSAMQWKKEKGQKVKQLSTKNYTEYHNWVTQNPTKN
jgi:hypothetical protein